MTGTGLSIARVLVAGSLLVAGRLLGPLAQPAAAQRPAERYDLLITGGSVFDGTGAAARVMDVAIRGDRIVAMATSLSPASAARVIDATGRTVSPALSDGQGGAERGPTVQTSIDALVPTWAKAGGQTELRKRLAEPALADSILHGIVDNILHERADLEQVQFSQVSWDTSLQGKTLIELAECRNLEPTPENGATVILEALLKGDGAATYRVLDGQRVLKVGAFANLVISAAGATGRSGSTETVVMKGVVAGQDVGSAGASGGREVKRARGW